MDEVEEIVIANIELKKLKNGDEKNCVKIVKNNLETIKYKDSIKSYNFLKRRCNNDDMRTCFKIKNVINPQFKIYTKICYILKCKKYINIL